MTPTAAGAVCSWSRTIAHFATPSARFWEAGHHITEVSDGPAALTALAGQPST